MWFLERRIRVMSNVTLSCYVCQQFLTVLRLFRICIYPPPWRLYIQCLQMVPFYLEAEGCQRRFGLRAACASSNLSTGVLYGAFFTISGVSTLSLSIVCIISMN